MFSINYRLVAESDVSGRYPFYSVPQGKGKRLSVVPKMFIVDIHHDKL
jgi:hypothetical protein